MKTDQTSVLPPPPLRMHDIVAADSAATHILALTDVLPRLNLDALTPEQINGLSTALNQLHGEVHILKQRITDTPVFNPNTNSHAS